MGERMIGILKTKTELHGNTLISGLYTCTDFMQHFCAALCILIYQVVYKLSDMYTSTVIFIVM